MFSSPKWGQFKGEGRGDESGALCLENEYRCVPSNGGLQAQNQSRSAKFGACYSQMADVRGNAVKNS